MFKFIRQLFCKHEWKRLGESKYASQSLWYCEKECGLYSVQHWGLGMGFKTNKPNWKEYL